MTVNEHASDIANTVAVKATYGGAATAVIGGLTANEFAAIVGAIVAILSFIANIVFKLRHEKILKEKLTANNVKDIDLG